jgi:hypothetical protein
MKSITRVALPLALVATLAAPRTTYAQASDTLKQRLVRELVAKARFVDQAMQVIEQAVPAQRATNPRVPEVFWDRFLEQVRARRGELEAGYVTIYDHNFTADEIRQLITFYESPIGKRLLEKQPVLLREGMALGQEWGARIGADVGRTLAGDGVR